MRHFTLNNFHIFDKKIRYTLKLIPMQNIVKIISSKFNFQHHSKIKFSLPELSKQMYSQNTVIAK